LQAGAGTGITSNERKKREGGTKLSLEDDSGPSIIRFIKNLIKKKHHLVDESDLNEEIHGLMDEGRAMGLITNEESDMVYRILALRDTKVYSIMIPRTEVSSASIDSTLGEVIRLVSECGHTRIPFCKENLDEIVGILHAKDLLKLWGKETESPIPMEILRTPYFVPKNKNISELLRELKERKTHLAIVTDEYGGTEGIITIEDILEEIVGEIMDEHDNESPLLTAIDDNTLLVDARLDIEKLEEYVGVGLPEGDYESVGGFIIHLLDRIPKKDETLSFKNLEMIVKAADERKIHNILIKIHPMENHPEAAA
jgi:magnesium and cobalt transporter